MRLSLPLVVLAAGLSKRYGRLKQLEPLGPNGEAIMDYNVYDALRSGFDEIVYVVRAEILEAVRDHVGRFVTDSVPVHFVTQELDQLPTGFSAPPERRMPWGTAHAVMCAARRHAGPFAVCNADDLYGPAAFAQVHGFLNAPEPSDEGSVEGALIGYPLRDTLNGGGGVARGLCHVGKDAELEHIVEVRHIRRGDPWIVGLLGDDTPIDLTGHEMVSMNLWALRTPMITGISRQFRRFLERWGAHPAREFFLSTAVNEHVRAYAARVRVLGAEERWHGVTYAEDREGFREALRKRIRDGVYPESLQPSTSRDT